MKPVMFVLRIEKLETGPCWVAQLVRANVPIHHGVGSIPVSVTGHK